MHSYLFFSQSGAESVQSPPAAVLPVPPVAPEAVDPVPVAVAALAVEPPEAVDAPDTVLATVEPVAVDAVEELCPKTKLKVNKTKIQQFNLLIVFGTLVK